MGESEGKNKRMSVNTSLKNARIFDDDAWEEKDGAQIQIKCEPEDDCEQARNVSIEDGEVFDKSDLTEIKREILDNTSPTQSTTVKNENDVKIKTEIKTEPSDIDSMFNNSPFNRELFSNFKIKEQTPVKTEDGVLDKHKRETRKSVRRTVFTRNSPYKRRDEEFEESREKKMSAFSRLGAKIVEEDEESSHKPSKKKEYENDSEILSRRQKQIDYGKNTVGYDNYVKTVPKTQRQPHDPQTPNKYLKYSRRGWDGLIRQWRLKLHKYDPESS